MANRVYLNGFESGDTGKNAPSDGNITVQTTVKRSGDRALKVDAQSGTRSTLQLAPEIVNHDPYFVRLCYNFASRPATQRTIAALTQNGQATSPELRVNPSGTLGLYEGSGGASLIGATPILALDAWYTVEIGFNGTDKQVALRLDGETIIDWTASHASSPSLYADLYVGVNDTVTASLLYYLDDVAFDRERWCEPGRVYRLNLASLAQDHAGWTLTGAADKVTAINDVGDDANYLTSGDINNQKILFDADSLPGDVVQVRGLAFYTRFRHGGGTSAIAAVTPTIQTGDFAHGPITPVTRASASAFGWGQWYSTGSALGWGLPVAAVNDSTYGLNSSNQGGASGIDVSALVVEADCDVASGAQAHPRRAFIAGCDTGDTTEFATTNGAAAASTVRVRTGNYAIRFNPTAGTNAYVEEALPQHPNGAAPVQEMYGRFYVWVDAYPSAGNSVRLFYPTNSGVTNGHVIRLGSDGEITIRGNQSTTIDQATSADGVIPTGEWVELEFYLRNSSTTTTEDGIVQVRVNGTQVVEATNLRSGISNLHSINMRFGPGGSSPACDYHYDDIVLDYSAWPGTSRIAELTVTGAGTLTASGWDTGPSAGGNRWEQLTDTPADDDTSYVITNTTTGSIESYQLGDAPANASAILAVVTAARIKRNGASNGSVSVGIRANGQSQQLSGTGTAGAAYTRVKRLDHVSPRAGIWTTEFLDGAEPVIRNGITQASRITTLRVTVEYREGTASQRELNADAYVIDSGTGLDVTADALVSAEATKQVTASAVVSDGSATAQVTADATVTGEYSRSVTASALVGLTDQAVEAIADAEVVAGSVDVDATADAVVQATATRNLTASGVVRATQTRQATGTGYIVAPASEDLTADGLVGPGAEVPADGLVQDIFNMQVFADGVIRAETVQDATADGYIGTDTTQDLEADGVVLAETPRSVAADAAIRTTAQAETDADAVVYDQGTAEVTADAEVKDVGVAAVDADATVGGEFARSLTADALVGQSGTAAATADGVVGYQFAIDLPTDAVVSAPTTQFLAVGADAVVTAVPLLDLLADALVTGDASGARHIAWHDGPWDTATNWRLAFAERVDGRALLAPVHVAPLEFAPAFAANAVAIAVAVDLSSADPQGALPLVLEAASGAPGGWTEIGRGVLTWEAREPFATGGEAVEVAWFVVGLEEPGSLAMGAVYRVRTEGTGARVIATRGAGGTQTSYGLNAIVVSDEPAEEKDTRPTLIAPLTPSNGATGTRTVTIRAVDAVAGYVHVGPGAELVLDPAGDVDWRVEVGISVAPGARLRLAPGAGRSSAVLLGPGAGVVVAPGGVLELAGHAKTRYARLASGVASTSGSLVLNESPTGWLPGDELLVGSTQRAESRVGVISSVVGTNLTLATPLGQAVAAGSLVLNLSRAAAIAGTQAGASLGYLRLKPGSTASFTSAELRRLGPLGAAALNPDDGAIVSGSDLVVRDGRVVGENDGGDGVRISRTSELSDLTIVRCRFGLILPTGAPAPGGRSILAAFNARDGACVLGTRAHMDILAQDLAGAAVLVTQGARLSGTIDNRWAKLDPALAAAGPSGVAGEVALEDPTLTIVAGEAGGALVRLNSGAGLGRLELAGATGTVPALRAEAGALLLGGGELRGCDLAGTNALVILDGDGCFVDLVDLDEAYEDLASLTDGVLAPGARVAARDRTERDTGRTIKTTAPTFTGAACLGLFALPGEEHAAEVGRLAVVAGEHLALRLAVRGEGTVWLEREGASVAAVESPDPLDWTEVDLDFTAPASGVLRLLARTAAGGSLFVDAVRRR